MRDRRIAVVGGGLAGLAAAYALERKGADVVVFEGEERLGGRASTHELEGLRIDPGAQLFGSMYSRFLSLVEEIGLGDRLVRVPGRDALWREGRAHEVVYGSVSSMVTSGGLPFRTKMRLGTTYVPFLSRHGRALDIHEPERSAEAGLDEESIASWGTREIDETFVGSLVYPQLGAYYGSSPEDTSAGFYHLLARYGMDVVLYAVAGGVGQVSSRLASRIESTGGEVRLGKPVRSLQLTPAGVTVVCDDVEETFHGAVSGLPAPALLPLLSGERPALREWLGSVRYRPSVSLVIVLDTPSDQRYFGLSFPRGETRYVAAVALQENKGVPLDDTDRGVLVAFPTPETAADLETMESREVLDRMLPEIAVALPGIEDRALRVRVYRWPWGSPQFYAGYLRHLGRFRTGGIEGDTPFVLAGDYLYGPSVEGAVVSGLEAAGRLSGVLS